MKKQTSNSTFGYHIAIAIFTLIAVPLAVMQFGYLEQEAQAKPAPASPTVMAPTEPMPISYCGTYAEVIMTPLNLMMIGKGESYQENLYSYKGERHIVSLPRSIDREQADMLLYAYDVAKADGHREPAVLQGLIWQESKAGGYKGHEVAGDEAGLKFGKRYYGVGQIKVAAAQDVFKRFPNDFPGFYQPRIREKQANGTMKTVQKAAYLKTNEEIIAHLIMDKKFNIRVASKYLWMMGRNEKRNYVRPTNFAITAYNRGLGGALGSEYNDWHYTVAVNKHKDTFLKEFNNINNPHVTK